MFEDKNFITKEGYDYKFLPSACASCGGACCTGESGYIWVKYREIAEIADFLELTIEEFATIYLRKVKHRYSIIEREIESGNYACIFFDNRLKRCRIYPVRPLQCRSFPFWEIFKKDKEEVKKECIGVVD
jgi:Fe-S-cluster containining protein